MKYSHLGILKASPWLAYIIFWYLDVSWRSYYSRHRLSARIISFIQLIFIPLLLLAWLLYPLIVKYGVNRTTVSIWSCAIMTGLYIGWFMAKRVALTFDIERRRVIVPGIWSTLLSVLLVFVGEYYINFSYVTNPLARNNIFFIGADLVLSGLVSGIALGKLWCFLNNYRKALKQ